jgi:hypothetical protein
MRLTGPKSYPALSQRGIDRYVSDADWDADQGADATTIRYQVANPRGHISLRVFLRLTAMDVCCGPPQPSPCLTGFEHGASELPWGEGRIPWEKIVQLMMCRSKSVT